MLLRTRRAVSRLSETATALVRWASSTEILSRPKELEQINMHRSNAMELIARVPVIEVAARVAMCDGGGGATGHPIEFIKLDRRDGAAPTTCKYCGLRFKQAAGHHH